MWPNLFVAGVEKAGTTSLWRYLDAHPEVFMSEVKEPSFFTSERHDAAATEADYLALFAGAAERWRGEASVRYFYDERAPERIHDVAPDARILIILRNPVDRAHSAYWGTVRSGYEERSFREAVDEELEEEHAASSRKAYVARSLYLEGVERFLHTFPNRTMVLFLEELHANPRTEMAGVYRFLDIDEGIAERVDLAAHNTYWQPRSRVVDWAMSSVRARALARRIVPKAVHRRLDRVLLVKGADKPELDPDLRKRLDGHFAAERPALESLLGRRLPW